MLFTSFLAGTYFVISEQPEPRGLVVFIICDVEVVCPGLENGVLTPTLCFGFSFYHFTGVQGGLDRGEMRKVVDLQEQIAH